jgi:hypothetical protein
LAASLTVSAARADDVANAEALFRRAKAHMAAGRHAEACPLLEESYRLDKAMGTLLNLALCNEQIGKIASAWGEFRAVEEQARIAVPPRQDRVDLAREHADKLEPRLSRLRIDVPDDARAPGLTIKVDGEIKGEPLWATGIVVDPGTRLVEASASGRKTRAIRVKIDDEGIVQAVTLTPLEIENETPRPDQGTDLTKVEEYAASSARRTTGFLIGGIGAATFLVGASFGIAAVVNNEAGKDCVAPCYRGEADALAADRAIERAKTFATVSNVTLAVGAVGILAGAFFVLTAGPSKRASLAPVVSPHVAGIEGALRW